MYDRAKDLVDAYMRRQLGRRELVRRMGQLGVAAVAANTLLGRASTRALAADFDWKQHEGTQLNLLMNKHPYMDAMVADLDNFKELTGMEVAYDVFPEDVYFDKVTAALSSGSSQYDAFMTGAYQTWQYGPAGWLVDLNEFIADPAMTNPELQLGGRPAEPARLDRVVGRARRRARRRGRQAVGDPLGLRAQLGELQQARVRRARHHAAREPART